MAQLMQSGKYFGGATTVTSLSNSHGIVELSQVGADSQSDSLGILPPWQMANELQTQMQTSVVPTTMLQQSHYPR